MKHWLNVCLAGSAALLLTLQVSAENEEFIIQPGEDYRPISFDRIVKPGSALDFSHLLDAPAGKYGFAVVRDGKLEFENRPGKEFRFFGSNLCMRANYPTHEQAIKMANHFAASGYNIVRFHHFDNPLVEKGSRDPAAFNAEMLDRMDFLMAEMKKRGIYTTTDLYVSRQIRPNQLKNLPKGGTGGNYKALIFFDDEAYSDWKRFGEKLLNHVNPYTKLAWKDDPALISLSLINEDTLYLCGNSGAIKPIVEKRYSEWIARNQIKLDDANQRRMKIKFFNEVYAARYRDMQKWLRQEIGVKALLTDQNSYASLPLTLGSAEYDLVDSHTYVGHPKFLKGGWKLPAEVTTHSALIDKGENFPQKGSQRIIGKPLTITEWDEVSPNPNAVEGVLIISGYGALQGWSGMCRFAYSHNDGVDRDQPVGFFDTIRNPVRTLSERVGALFFIRGDVKTSEWEIPLILRRDYLDHPGYTEKSRGYENSIPDLYKNLGLFGRVGTKIAAPGEKVAFPGNQLVLTAQPRPEDPAGALDVNDPANFDKVRDITGGRFNPQKGVFISSTGQLRMDCNAQTLAIVTPRSEGFIVPPGKTLAGDFARVENQRGAASFLIGAIDEKPLKESRRMIILHLTDVKNTGMKFKDHSKKILLEWGTLPLLMYRGRAKITLPEVAANAKLRALDWSGTPFADVALHPESVGGSSFVADSFIGDKPVAAYELTR